MLSALRARWVSTWPTVQPGSRLGAAPSRVPAREAFVEHGQQPLVGGRRAGDVAVELPGVHRRHRTPGRQAPRAGASSRERLCAMQLGMIGLGRMGANMVRRLERAGHECVGYDVDAGGGRGAGRRGGGRRRRRSTTSSAKLDSATPRVDHGPGRLRRLDDRRARPAARARRHDHRRRQLVVPRRHRPGRPARRRARHRLRRRRHQRRHPRARAGLLPDGRRPGRGRGAAGADLRRPRPRRRRRRTHADAGASPASRARPSAAGCTAAPAAPATS